VGSPQQARPYQRRGVFLDEHKKILKSEEMKGQKKSAAFMLAHFIGIAPEMEKYSVGRLGVEGLGVGVEWVSSRHHGLSRAMALHVSMSVGRSLSFSAFLSLDPV
jgi:hypothetical protein